MCPEWDQFLYPDSFVCAEEVNEMWDGHHSTEQAVFSSVFSPVVAFTISCIVQVGLDCLPLKTVVTCAGQ